MGGRFSFDSIVRFQGILQRNRRAEDFAWVYVDSIDLRGSLPGCQQRMAVDKIWNAEDFGGSAKSVREGNSRFREGMTA